MSRPETVRHDPGLVFGGGVRRVRLQVGLDAVVDDAVVVAGVLGVVTGQPVLMRPGGSGQ